MSFPRVKPGLIRLKYNIGIAPTIILDPLEIEGSITTNSNGVATVYLTDDGTSSGTALFDSINSIELKAANNTSTAINVPIAAEKLLSADLKTLTINVVMGANTGLLGGNSAQFVGSGIIVRFTVKGN